MLRPQEQPLKQVKVSQEQSYLDRLAQHMQAKMAADWKPEARKISSLLQQEGLLHSSPPLNSPQQFLIEAISENQLVQENSMALDLMQQNYRPQMAASAFEIASMLVPPESA